MTSPPSLTRTLRLSRPPEAVAAWVRDPTRDAQLPGIEVSSTDGLVQLEVPEAPGGSLHVTAAPDGDRIAWHVDQDEVDGAARLQLKIGPDGAGSRVSLEAGPTADRTFAARSAELASTAIYQLLLNLDGLEGPEPAEEESGTRRARPRDAASQAIRRHARDEDPAPTDEMTTRFEVGLRVAAVAAVAVLIGLVLWLWRRGRNVR